MTSVRRTELRQTTRHCGVYSFRNDGLVEGEGGGRGGTRPDDEGQCQIPGTVDNPARKGKTERKTNECTEKVLSPVHTVTARADERDICEDEGYRKKRKMSEDGGPRRRGELFPNVSSRGGHRRARETGKRKREANASSGRSFDHLGNEMPGNWKSLNAPVCEDAYGNRRCSPSSREAASALPPSSPPSPPFDDEFRARVVAILNRANLHCQLQNQTSRIRCNLGELNA